jgi:uncharacterized repeat protein (TIGR03803 family)
MISSAGMHDLPRVINLRSTIGIVLVVALAAFIATPSALAQTYSVRWSFNGPNGSNPFTNPVVDSEGNLYGTTNDGGQNNFGTIFKLDPQGLFVVLYNFTDPDFDGYPLGPNSLIISPSGDLFGTTQYGGYNKTGFCIPNGCGTIFTLSDTGEFEVLYEFLGYPDGQGPYGSLVFGHGKSLLYGTTSAGGKYECGTVFAVGLDAEESVLYDFCSADFDGRVPTGSLAIDSNGNLYGTTEVGGTQGTPIGAGTIFSVSSAGAENILYNFCSKVGSNGECTDGWGPEAGVVRDKAGDLFGTTPEGGLYNCSTTGGCGTLFGISPTRKQATLFSFGGNPADGEYPAYGTLALDPKGNIYGATPSGGDPTCDCGVLFKFVPGKGMMVLHTFTGSPSDGAYPYGGVILDSAGNIYGTTAGGGSYGQGTVYSYTPPPA